MENFNQAIAQANLLYGLNMNEDDAIEVALIAWNKIGNRQCMLYKFRGPIDKITLSIDLPCNCDEIEAVTYDFEDWKYTSNDTVNGDYQSQFIENYIESRKLYSNSLYISGRYVKYDRVDDTLYFDKNYGMINILYKGIVLDDQELPQLSDKEVNAIACYLAYTKRFKEGWATHDQRMLQEAQLLEQQWYKLCSAARVPYKVSQNDMNKVLDAKTNFNRKIFNKSYKPIH